MVVPKINSSHGSETRNIINTAIDSINAQGKTIQDLVAEGQLTSEQYAQLITVINGHLKSGDVTLYDIDFNLKKIGLEHLSEEVKKSMTGETPILSEVADGAVSEVKILDKAVSRRKTDFFVSSKNLASDVFEEWTMLNVAGSWLIQKETSGYLGSMQFVKIQPNTTYTIKIHEPTKANRFKVATSATSPSFNEAGHFNSINILKSDDVIKDFTFTSGTNHNYLYVYVSNASQRPNIQIEEGAVATSYVPHFILPENLIYPSIDDRYIKVDNTVTVVEDFKEGYKKRPNATSVIWIGPNEPIEAEPYDEWRETEGYTHFTDFSKNDIGVAPSDWTVQWNSFSVNTVTSDGEEKRLEYRPGSNAVSMLKWDEPGMIKDSEIFVSGKMFGTTDSGLLSVVHRGSGVSGNESGYIVGVRGRQTDSLFSVSRIVDGVMSSRIQEVSITFDLTKEFHILSRIDGNRIRAKVWAKGDKEPSNWQLDYTDTTNPIATSGAVGVYGYSGAFTYTVNEFGVGTDGMRAPRRKVL